jgi:hypothetical protein
MANLPTGVGSFKIDGRVLRGIADTVEDVDTKSEGVALNAIVTFVPTITKPTTVLPDGIVLYVSEVKAVVDQQGYIRPPADGQKSDYFDAAGNLWLISPSSPGLLDQGWTWTAHFRPQNGESFAEFTVSGISGAPGESVVLTTSSISGSAGWTQVVFYEVTTLAEPWPSGYRVGIDYLLLTTTNPMQLWKDK